ncbi:hypothetical protein JFK97_03020 [Chromobacterium phragmitis]|uniref:hypothetical protein n=2 Tax=Chromobacterium amazonense TaxID=1382803 RepID=UPI0021B722C5|nr:hypothetical protein [Chromobacterium amazonense]MBM2883349.1 hypothetical protein [Chromobacterium amazonense]
MKKGIILRGDDKSSALIAPQGKLRKNYPIHLMGIAESEAKRLDILNLNELPPKAVDSTGRHFRFHHARHA